ncbi:MAG: DEAD/DEAH box helicase [Oligoflexia bacterium]|nr:DEAD/DEAH box helicase [Oligoflexia bacterium]MBF0367666.1 DEAD/DEAH box helicase [Oligoflexia bacterium]
MNWSDLSLSPEIVKLIDKAGHKTPTPVQRQTIPLVVAGHDVLVSSQTGSGKTAAFVLPVLERFKGKNGTYILALSPTREIAQQTGAAFEMFGAPLGLKTVVCIGGASIPAEKEALASSPHIIVATPGRLCDHLERGNVWLDFIQCLIFDEADRMLDMGFAAQIELIAKQIPKAERQTLMFSATFAPKVEALARSVMKNPKEVVIKNSKNTTPKIDQRLMWVEEENKASTLIRLLRSSPGSVMVFAKSKERVYQIWRSLHASRIDAAYIHSDLTQEQRERVVADFKAHQFRVLVATDVMGRGIDVDDIAHVVNYDVPRLAEDYIHRIGRTGRRGKSGKATTFAIPRKDEQGIRAIERILGSELPYPHHPRQEPAQRSHHSQAQGRDYRAHNHNRDQYDGYREQRKALAPKIKPAASSVANRTPTPPIIKTEKKSPGFFMQLKQLFSSK